MRIAARTWWPFGLASSAADAYVPAPVLAPATRHPMVVMKAPGPVIHRGLCPRYAAAILVGVSIATGCSAWKPPSLPGMDDKAAANREKYGATADQRITELEAEAKTAQSGTDHAQLEFTRKLVDTMLDEHDPRVRSAIVRLATDFDTAAATAICKGGLNDPDERVRMAACTAWARRGGPEAVQLLAARSQTDTELDVRLRAIRELGELQDKDAIPALAKALEDPDPAMQYRAVGSLKKVSGRDLGDDVNKWRAWAADPEGSAEDWSIAEAFRRLF